MSTTKERVDIGAIAGMVTSEAASRLADAISLALESCEEKGFPLAERQRAEILNAALLALDGFERTVLIELATELAGTSVEAWGWHSKYDDAMRGDDA